MKIAFLSSLAHFVLDENETRTSGGAELQVALLARTLAARGHDVLLLAGDTGQPDEATLQGVRVRNAGNFHTGRNLEMLGSLPRLLRLLRQEKPGWIFVLGWTAWLFVLWALRPFFGFRLGFICGLDTEVSGEFRRQHPWRGGLFEFAMRHCDIRFAMTEWQRSLFRERGLSCSIYRNLVLPRQTNPPGVGDKTVDFLWVSRCRPIKRPELFLELARALPEAGFVMICPPEDRDLFATIKQQAERLPNLELIPGVPYQEIQQRYDAAHIFVNTSEWEGWANSFIQSGQGRAALLSLVVRPDRLFDDYNLGYCADGDWDLFVRRAGEMLHDRARTRAMGEECARFVEEMHDNEKETSAFLAGLVGGSNDGEGKQKSPQEENFPRGSPHSRASHNSGTSPKQ